MNMETSFKIPICYNKKVKKLNNAIVEELELIKLNELTKLEEPESEQSKSDSFSIYEHVFNPTNGPSKQIVEQLATHYTTDVHFLKDTQKLLKSLELEVTNTIQNKYGYDDFKLNELVGLWEEIKGETGFCEKYLYVDWTIAKELNNNSSFLQVMSIYNVASPLLSLCLPIFVLIIPFFIIKAKGIELNIKQYVDILKVIISNHSMFKILTQFHEVDNTQKMYLAVSALFYLFSIYQNILICIRFYSNIQKIHIFLFKFRQYLSYTIEIMDYVETKVNGVSSHKEFNEMNCSNKKTLMEFKTELDKITPFAFSFSKVLEIGHIMSSFYKLYDNKVYHEAFLYSFGFNGYFNVITKLKHTIQEKRIVKTTFYKGKVGEKEKGKEKETDRKPLFKKMYYPKFIKQTVVKNDCKLDKNMIISGPNASGKTTVLKTAFINILLSQQIGYGCFESLKLTPYDHFHCYLNIPDTSGRDSLFQAEARRCKEIIDCINKEKGTEETHLCIFDELYSGTNPDEAVASAYAFMDYIVKHENVTCLLTTHYTKLCKKMESNKNVKNYHMKTKTGNYTYLLKEGISSVKGGIKVLKDLDYPDEIINSF